MIRSRIIRNVAGGDGGGITGSVDGPTVISRSTIADNRAGEGGGVMVVDQARITDSTIAGNHVVGGGDGEVGDGAGIYVDDEGVLTLVNATLTGNRAHRHGAAVFGEAGGRAALRAVTIARNRADADGSGDGAGGGVYADRARFTLSNAIVALNTAAGGARADCDATGTVTGSPNLAVGARHGRLPARRRADRTRPTAGAAGRQRRADAHHRPAARKPRRRCGPRRQRPAARPARGPALGSGPGRLRAALTSRNGARRR